MLTLTDNARTAVQDLTRQAQLPQEGGLRIAASPSVQGSLELSLVPAPVEGDDVIEEAGARVFVEPQASDVLADQTLDAETTPEGAGFSLRPQQ